MPAYFAETGQVTQPRPPAGRPGTLAPVGPMVLDARWRGSPSRWSG